LCLVTAAISLTLVYWAWDEVRVSLAYLRIVWVNNHDWRLMWDAFWGNRREELDVAAEQLLSREVK
ncbi:MAG: vitamin K epoxide reductase, partial [Rhodopirellula sp. JB053]